MHPNCLCTVPVVWWWMYSTERKRALSLMPVQPSRQDRREAKRETFCTLSPELISTVIERGTLEAYAIVGED